MTHFFNNLLVNIVLTTPLVGAYFDYARVDALYGGRLGDAAAHRACADHG